MGQPCPSPSLQCPWQPKPETIQSLLLFAVIASRGPRRSSMGGRSCEAPLAPFPGRGPVSPRAARCNVQSRCLHTYNICPEGGHSFLPGRRFHGAHRPPLSLVYCSRLPAPTVHPVVRLYLLLGSRAPACLRFSGNPLGSRRRSFRKPGQAGGINPGRQGRGCWAWARGHGGGAVRTSAFFLPRGAAKGAELDTCGGRSVEDVDNFFFFFSCSSPVMP